MHMSIGVTKKGTVFSAMVLNFFTLGLKQHQVEVGFASTLLGAMVFLMSLTYFTNHSDQDGDDASLKDSDENSDLSSSQFGR